MQDAADLTAHIARQEQFIATLGQRAQHLVVAELAHRYLGNLTRRPASTNERIAAEQRLRQVGLIGRRHISRVIASDPHHGRPSRAFFPRCGVVPRRLCTGIRSRSADFEQLEIEPAQMPAALKPANYLGF